MALTPSQADVLRELARHPGATAEEIVAATGLPAKGVGWNLSELSGRGLVEVEAGGTRYALTPRGLRTLEKLGP